MPDGDGAAASPAQPARIRCPYSSIRNGAWLSAPRRITLHASRATTRLRAAEAIGRRPAHRRVLSSAPGNIMLMTVSSPSDADVAMERYSAGDDAAFVAVYDAVAPQLHAYLLRRTRNSARADDLLQQTMLHIHRARGILFRARGS